MKKNGFHGKVVNGVDIFPRTEKVKKVPSTYSHERRIEKYVKIMALAHSREVVASIQALLATQYGEIYQYRCTF